MPTSAATQFCFFYFSCAPSLYNILIFHERDKLVFTDLVRICLELIALSGQVWVGLPKRDPFFKATNGHVAGLCKFVLQDAAVNK